MVKFPWKKTNLYFIPGHRSVAVLLYVSNWFSGRVTVRITTQVIQELFLLSSLNWETVLCAEQSQTYLLSSRPGDTVLYAVQPKFRNVDIKIVIDVTQGS